MRRFWILILLFFSACSSAPREAPPAESRPAWISGPARSLEGDRIFFVGIGEDRSGANAKPKAEAMALQDLANECSLVPKEARVEAQGLEDEIGIIHRSFARVSVPAAACTKAREALPPAQIRALADPTLQARIRRYQSDYDPPEQTETPGVDTSALDPYSRYYALRQQVALAKQAVVLDPGSPGKNLPTLTQAALSFARERVEVTAVAHAFSERRPNVTAHQPSAVRDTVAERKRIEDTYPETPVPSTRPHGKGRGRGMRRRIPLPSSTPPPAPGT
jgi:hypothetical protein